MTARHNIGATVCLALTVGLFVLLAAGPLHAATATWHVESGGTGNGTDWYGSAASLTNALETAGDGDAIWIAEGTYTNASEFSCSVSNIRIYGGFTNGMTDFNERDWTNYPALLDGLGTHRVLSITSAGNVHLDGLVLTNGVLDTNASYEPGGSGLKADGYDQITLTDVKIVDCEAGNFSYGGATYFSGGTIAMTDCEIRGNRLGQYNSGIGIAFRDGPTVTMTDCVFAENTREGSTWEISGGGFSIVGGSVTASNCLFYDNSAVVARNGVANQGCGSAVMLEDGAVGTFTDCVFSNNVMLPFGNSPGHGGAISVGRHDSGGACQATFRNCTIISNGIGSANATTYPQEGGAFFIDRNSTLTVVNSLIAGNSLASNLGGTGHGGAFYLEDGSVYVTNCTIADNHSPGNGGAIYVMAGTFELKNCILDGNTADGDGNDIYNFGGTVDVDHSRLSADGFPAILDQLESALHVRGALRLFHCCPIIR